MTLIELIGLMRKHLALVIALPVVFAAAVAAYSYLAMPDEYTATTSMYVLYSSDDSESDTSTFSTSQMIANDVTKLFMSERVRREAMETTGVTSLADYDVEIESGSSTRVITLKVTGPDPQGVSALANAMAENVASITSEITGADSISVLDAAQVPDSPSGPRRILFIIVAFLAGLLLALLIIVLADMLNTKVRNSEEVSSLTGGAIIGRFPIAKKKASSEDERNFQNAAQTLLANIRLSGVDDPICSIAVTSAAPNEGKTVISIELARAAARGGSTVLLVECDMRRRSLADTLGVRTEGGLYDVLMETWDFESSVVAVEKNLWFLDAESFIPNPPDTIASKRFRHFVEDVRNRFDYVIFDTPPVIPFVDATVLSTVVDGTVVVVKEGTTKRAELKSVYGQLKNSGGMIVGICMNGCRSGRNDYYENYYRSSGNTANKAASSPRTFDSNGYEPDDGFTGQLPAPTSAAQRRSGRHSFESKIEPRISSTQRSTTRDTGYPPMPANRTRPSARHSTFDDGERRR